MQSVSEAVRLALLREWARRATCKLTEGELMSIYDALGSLQAAEGTLQAMLTCLESAARSSDPREIQQQQEQISQHKAALITMAVEAMVSGSMQPNIIPLGSWRAALQPMEPPAAFDLLNTQIQDEHDNNTSGALSSHLMMISSARS